jgi:hypothetical protein
MLEKPTFLGSWWSTIFFSLLLLAGGISIGYDLKLGELSLFKTPETETTEKQKVPVNTSKASPDQQPVQNILTAKPDSQKVIQAQLPQVQEPIKKSPPPGFYVMEAVVPLGKSKSLVGGRLLLTVSPDPSEDSTEVEVIVRRTKSPLEREMEYGEIIRLFYAHTGRQESFRFEGSTYYIDCLEVGQIDHLFSLRFALYES